MPQKEALSAETLKAFESVPDRYLILSPDLHILTASDAYLAATLSVRHEIVGKNLFEAFPDNPETPQANAVTNLQASFQKVLDTGKPQQLAFQRYDVPRPPELGGGFEEKYWNPVNTPVLDEQGEVLYIIHKISDVTEEVKNQQHTRALDNQKANWEREKLQALYMQAPVAIGIFEGKDHVIELINPRMSELLGRCAEALLHKPLFEALPEMAGQGFEDILAGVFYSGIPYEAKEVSVKLNRDGKRITGFYNIVYQPLRNAREQITGIIQISTEVTEQVEARQQLEESEEKYRSLFETMDQGFCILEMLFDGDNNPVDYRFLETNPTFEEQTGLQKAKGKTARELEPNLEQHWFEIYGKVALSGESARLTQSSEAMGRWFEINAFRLGDSNSRKVALLFTDITQRKQAEENLKRSNSWFRLVNQATQDTIWDWDLEKQEITWNEGLVTMFNYEPGEGKSEASWWFDHIHPEDREMVVQDIHENIEGGEEHWSREYRFLTGDGTYKIVFDRGFVMQDEDGHSIRMIGSMQDITERKRAEEALKESEGRLRATVETTPDCIKIVDFEGRLRFMNKAGHQMIEANTTTSVKGSSVLELVAPENRDNWIEMHQRVCQGESLSWEFDLIGLQGTRRWMETHAVPLENPDGSFSQLAVTRDISDRKRAEEEKQKLIAILEASSDYVGMASLEGKSMYVNAAGLKMIGLDSWEGLSIIDNVYPEDRPLAENVLLPKLLKEGHFSHEIRFWNRKTGKPFWIIWKGITIKNSETGEIIALATISPDITERKQAEQALKDSEERFARVIEGSNDGIWDWDFKNDTAWWNQRYSEIMGVDIPEAERGFRSISKYIHADDQQLIPEALKAHLERGEKFRVEYRIIHPSGEIRYILGKGKAVLDEQDKITRLSGTITDFTERRQAEEDLKSKNEQLTRINNDLDNFIYTASHDLKAPILNIEGLVNLLKKSFSPEAQNAERVESLMGMIHTSIDRFKETIKDLSEVAKVQSNAEEEVFEVRFEEILEEVRFNIKSLIDESDANIQTEFSQASSIYYSKKNLRSIMYNLVSNAIKYRSPDRPLQINITTSRPDDEHLLLSVQDNGLGIKEKDKAKVFMMFKRLHQHVEGTGIGMAIVKKIIDNSGGRIELESKEGKGSLFKIYFKV